MLTAKRQKDVLREFRKAYRHDSPEYVEEHGGRFVTCKACGAIVAVAFDGAGHPLFDDIEDGDESCNR